MWVRYPVTWVMIPGWAETIWSIEVMSLGLVYEGYQINLPEHFPLVLHGLLWYFPNIQATQGGSFLALLIFFGITPLLDNLRIYLGYLWFSLCFQTRISFSYRTKHFTVDHRLGIYYLARLGPTKYLFTSSKLVGIWYGLSVGVRRSSPIPRLLSWPKSGFYRCIPRKPLWCAPLGWQIWVDLTLSGISRCLLGLDDPWNPPLWARKVLIGYENQVHRLIPRLVFCLEVRVTGWDPQKEGYWII